MSFKLIAVFSLLIWFAIPIVHWRRKFFSYFLILGLTDIINLILTYAFELVIFYPYILSSLFLILALQSKEFVIKYRYYLIPIVSVIFYLGIIYHSTWSVYILLSLHIIILIRILYLFVIDVGNNLRLNLFYVFLLFYEITVISKFLNILFNLVDGAMYFNITTAFEIFIGLFFLFFRYDNSRIVFQLK